MTTLRRVPLEEMSPAFRDQVLASKELGVDTRFLEFAANAPHMIEFYWGDFYDRVFFGGIVPIRTKELVRLKLSQLHGCLL